MSLRTMPWPCQAVVVADIDTLVDFLVRHITERNILAAAEVGGAGTFSPNPASHLKNRPYLTNSRYKTLKKGLSAVSSPPRITFGACLVPHINEQGAFYVSNTYLHIRIV